MDKLNKAEILKLREGYVADRDAATYGTIDFLIAIHGLAAVREKLEKLKALESE